MCMYNHLTDNMKNQSVRKEGLVACTSNDALSPPQVKIIACWMNNEDRGTGGNDRSKKC